MMDDDLYTSMSSKICQYAYNMGQIKGILRCAELDLYSAETALQRIREVMQEQE